jgi:hypothetical protein
MRFTIFFAIYIALVTTFLISGAAYFILGERVLRKVRSRYPDQWREHGEPTFVSLAILTPRWWRPISASNFFACGEYRAIGDTELTHRADVVRVLQRTTNWTTIAFAVLAFVARKIL